MKKMILSCMVAGSILCSLFGKESEVVRAVNDGAKAKLTLHVVDLHGQSVTNADVHVGFNLLSGKTPDVATGQTDTNGIFIAEGLCSVYANCWFTKDGYYKTDYMHRFLTDSPDCVKDGKWQPWNPTIEITLKEKRNPIQMIARQVEIKLPNRDEPFGFDFQMGDLVKPYGKGEQTDLLFKCNIEERGHIHDYKMELFVTAVLQDEGIIVNKTDGWSQFKTAYEAQESGYEPLYYLVTDRTPSKILQKIEFTQAEYLTFRSRIARDDEGKIISSHYGTIIDVLSYHLDDKNPDGAIVRLLYFFNPTPNDRNLESK